MSQTEAIKLPANGFLSENSKSGLGLDKVPRWIDTDFGSLPDNGDEDASFSNPYFADPLAFHGGTVNGTNRMISRFPVDHDISSKIYMWKGEPWNLSVDAIVNSTNEVSSGRSVFINNPGLS